MKRVRDGYNDFYHEEDFYPNLREEDRTWVKYEVFVSGDKNADLYKEFYYDYKAIKYAESLVAEGKSVMVYRSVYSQYGEEDSQVIWEDGKDLRNVSDSRKIKDADETQDVLDGILMIAFNDGSEEEGYNEVKKHANEQGELDGVQYETYDVDNQDGVTLIDLCAATDDANAFVKALLTEWGIIDAVADIEFEKSELMENAEEGGEQVSDSKKIKDGISFDFMGHSYDDEIKKAVFELMDEGEKLSAHNVLEKIGVPIEKFNANVNSLRSLDNAIDEFEKQYKEEKNISDSKKISDSSVKDRIIEELVTDRDFWANEMDDVIEAYNLNITPYLTPTGAIKNRRDLAEYLLENTDWGYAGAAEKYGIDFDYDEVYESEDGDEIEVSYKDGKLDKVSDSHKINDSFFDDNYGYTNDNEEGVEYNYAVFDFDECEMKDFQYESDAIDFCEHNPYAASVMSYDGETIWIKGKGRVSDSRKVSDMTKPAHLRGYAEKYRKKRREQKESYKENEEETQDKEVSDSRKISDRKHYEGDNNNYTEYKNCDYVIEGGARFSTEGEDFQQKTSEATIWVNSNVGKTDFWRNIVIPTLKKKFKKIGYIGYYTWDKSSDNVIGVKLVSDNGITDDDVMNVIDEFMLICNQVSDSKVSDMTKPTHLRGYAEKYRKKRREQKESYKENEEETQDKEVSDSRRIKDYVVGTKHPQEYFAELRWMLESLKKRGYIDAYLDDDIIKGFAEYYDYPSLREFNEWGDEEVAAGFDEYLESLE